MAARGLQPVSCCSHACRAAVFVPSLRLASLPVSYSAVVSRRQNAEQLVQSVEKLAAISEGGGARRRVGWHCSIQASPSGLVETEDKLKKLEGVKLYDPSGTAVSLVDLWERRVAVVAFGRHFGCLLCRKRAELLQSRKGEMDAAGVALVLVAPGSPEQARKFVEQTKFSGEVYADPDHASYEALQFVKGANSVFNAKSGFSVAKAFIEGFRQDWGLSMYQDTLQRGGWQQGGILVAGPGTNTLRYLFKDVEAGDEPNLEDVMFACCSG